MFVQLGYFFAILFVKFELSLIKIGIIVDLFPQSFVLFLNKLQIFFQLFDLLIFFKEQRV